jgi:hypothetical protein
MSFSEKSFGPRRIWYRSEVDPSFESVSAGQETEEVVRRISRQGIPSRQLIGKDGRARRRMIKARGSRWRPL